MMTQDNTLNFQDGWYGATQTLPGYGGGGSSQSQATRPVTAPAAADNSNLAALIMMALLGGF